MNILSPFAYRIIAVIGFIIVTIFQCQHTAWQARVLWALGVVFIWRAE